MFGFSEEQVSEFGVTFGLAAFIGYMLFIVWNLARKSNAGRLGTFVLSPNWLPFALWLVAGGLFAAIVFAIAAVSVPMLLDRDVNLPVAALTSVRVVGANPVAMTIWAGLVMLVTLFGLALVLPMIVLVPVLGHATWHAYADSVDAGALAPRML